MLDEVSLNLKCSKSEWKEKRNRLQDGLYNLARACRDHRVPVLILLEGWDAAGKGKCINYLAERQDPRGLKAEFFSEPRSNDLLYPWLWRFWQRLPAYGEITIFDTSWYRRLFWERPEGKISAEEAAEAPGDILQMERQLHADGMLILKFWLHISRQEQARRFQEIQEKGALRFRVTEQEWVRNRNYETYKTIIDGSLQTTHTPANPWWIIPATDQRYATLQIMERSLLVISEMLEKKKIPIVEQRWSADDPGRRQDR